RHAGALVSDDLIRVRVPDEALRLYLARYLPSRWARDQLLRNEYGAVQQHLEPEHVRALLVPLPDDPERLAAAVDAAGRAAQLRDQLHAATLEADAALERALGLK